MVRSPRPLASDEDEDPADGDEAVLEGVHGQDGELGSVLQGKDGEQPPAPGGTIGYGLWVWIFAGEMSKVAEYLTLHVVLQ